STQLETNSRNPIYRASVMPTVVALLSATGAFRDRAAIAQYSETESQQVQQPLPRVCSRLCHLETRVRKGQPLTSRPYRCRWPDRALRFPVRTTRCGGQSHPATKTLVAYRRACLLPCLRGSRCAIPTLPALWPMQASVH